MHKTDRAILRALQEDCTQSLARISQQVDISVTSCHRRIKTLESRGYIQSRRAILDSKALGYAVTGVFMVRLFANGEPVAKQINDRILSEPRVVSCYLATGEYDFIITARFCSSADYNDYNDTFLERFSDLRIERMSSSLVLQTLQEHGGVPV
ncbi:MAG: Lrp/AsnC family transcriptional regulator [Pseudoprimorskyibacter sp.]|jgi:DNA-binding Lrp family transcriptional regulator|nr:Lrp/AsnC family transcriptional regulator [Pseudoprimorskyibacter sp.]